MTACGVYASSAITSLTAQNTTGVYGIFDVPPEFLKKQLDCIFTDIYPDAVKIGMTATAETVSVISERLRFYKARNIVVDPVMVSTSGARLIGEEAAAALKERLFGLAILLTPNIPEAEAISGRAVETPEDMLCAARQISETFGCAVLCKGGHNRNDANDLLVLTDGNAAWFNGQRIDNPNTHGTGCTLSSAIASNLAKGYDLETAVRRAKAYISGALAAMLDLGHGSGPMNHAFALDNEWSKEAEA